MVKFNRPNGLLVLLLNNQPKLNQTKIINENKPAAIQDF